MMIEVRQTEVLSEWVRELPDRQALFTFLQLLPSGSEACWALP